MSDAPLVRDDGGERDVARAETLARWLDDRYLDPILGFVVPGVGDLAGALLGGYVVFVALKRKLPAVTVARMLVNLAVDAGVGAVPVAGDLFDLVWKANRRNVTLLRARHEARHDTAGDWLRVGGAALLVAVAVALPIALFWWLVHLVAAHAHGL